MIKKNKLYLLDPIIIDKREIYPIARLGLNQIMEDNIIYIKYTVVAICIKEDENIYYKNILLSEEDFDLLKNSSII